MPNIQIEAYRKIAEKLAQIDQLMRECNQIASNAGVMFTYPVDIVDNLKSTQGQGWQASELC